MANPQKENGYTAIANEIWEALWKAGLNGTEWEVLTVVIRRTYGFQKKEDWISYTQFEKLTQKTRPAIWKAITSLVNKRLLVNKRKPGRTLYRFNKDYSQWLVNKRKLVNKQKSTSKQSLTQLVNKRLLTKETITKETIQKKDTNVSVAKATYGNEEINKILEAIGRTVGIEDFKESRKQQRVWGNNLYRLMKNITASEFRRRLDLIVEDDFKHKNCGSLRFIYREIKGFIEPKSNHIIITT